MQCLFLVCQLESMHSRLLARHRHACRSAATMQDTSSHFRKCCIPHISKAASKTAQNKSNEQRSVKQNALALHHLHSHVDLRIQICIQIHLFEKFCLRLQDPSVLRSLSMGFLQLVVQHIQVLLRFGICESAVHDKADNSRESLEANLLLQFWEGANTWLKKTLCSSTTSWSFRTFCNSM